MPHLESWARYGDRFGGTVTGHPRHKDGEEIVTSRVTGWDGETFLTRSGSRYTLGLPHPRYERQFPNARQRVINTLNQQFPPTGCRQKVCYCHDDTMKPQIESCSSCGCQR